MGDTPDQTLTEIDRARASLEQNLAVLQERIPPSDEVKQKAAVYGGGAVGAGVLLLVIRSATKKRAKTKTLDREAARYARAVAAAIPDVIRVETRALGAAPLPVAAEDDDSSSRAVGAAVVAALIGAAVAAVRYFMTDDERPVDIAGPQGELP